MLGQFIRGNLLLTAGMEVHACSEANTMEFRISRSCLMKAFDTFGKLKNVGSNNWFYFLKQVLQGVLDIWENGYRSQ